MNNVGFVRERPRSRREQVAQLRPLLFFPFVHGRRRLHAFGLQRPRDKAYVWKNAHESISLYTMLPVLVPPTGALPSTAAAPRCLGLNSQF